MRFQVGRPAVLAVALAALLVLVPGPALAEDESLPAEDRQTTFTRMMEIALEIA